MIVDRGELSFYLDIRPLRRILMVVPSYGSPCGIANYSKCLIDALGERRVAVVPVTDVGSLERGLSFRSGDILHIQFEYVLYDINRLCSVCTKAKASGIPIVVTFHDYARALRDVNSKIIRLADRIIAHSELIKNAMERDFPGLRSVKAVVVPIGCKAVSSYGKSLALEGKSLAPASKGLMPKGKASETAGPRIAFFGFMAPQKGIVNLVEACAKLSKEYPGIRLFIFSAYGKPFEGISKLCHSELEEAVKRLGMAERTVLNTDYLSEERLLNLLSGMDLIVLPYSMPNHFGSSMAVRDVMRAGRPVIVTDIPFFSELRDEVYKIPGNRPEEISEGIRRLLRDEELGRKMVLAAWRYIKANSWERTADRHIRIYRALNGVESAAGIPGIPKKFTTEISKEYTTVIPKEHTFTMRKEPAAGMRQVVILNEHVGGRGLFGDNI